MRLIRENDKDVVKTKIKKNKGEYNRIIIEKFDKALNLQARYN